MNKPMNPAFEIEIFIRIVDLGSFAAVAKETNLTPSAISKIISRLESRLGVKLLQRTTRQLAMTQEGEIYYARGEAIVSAIEAAEAEITADQGQVRGRIRVSTGSAFAKHTLTPLMSNFQKLYPDITMDLLVSDGRVDLIADKIDVAIRVGPLLDSNLITRNLGEVRRIIVASPDYIKHHGEPKTALDLASHNCLSLQGFPRLAKWPMYVDGKRKLIAVSGSVTTDSADVLLDMAVAGIGIVRLGDFLGREALKAGKIISLLDGQHDEDSTPISVLMPPGRQHVPRVRAFVDFLQAKMKV